MARHCRRIDTVDISSDEDRMFEKAGAIEHKRCGVD